MKLLLDEMISPKLVARLAERGIYAVPIAHLGRSGLRDAALFRLAYERDMAVVTATARDYLTIAADCELHPGLIVLRRGDLTADEQWAYLEPVVDLLLSGPDVSHGLVNEVVEITGIGRFRRYPMP